MSESILINGNFLCRSLTGIERFAFETLKQIDLLLKPEDDWAIYVPANAKIFPEFKKIKLIIAEEEIKSFPKWDICIFKKACKRLGRTGLNFSNTAPFGKNTGYAFIHDIYGYDCPGDFKSFRSRLIRHYSIIHARNIARKAKIVFTVSEFSKKQIIKAFNVSGDRIKVIPNGWDHFKLLETDNSIFERFPELKENEFYFTLGSLQKRKNLKWIASYASKHPQERFAISGKIVSGYESEEINALKTLKNVTLVGYVKDEEVKALMNCCKAFVFPSLYEGFGIPPLEALSCGTRIVISKEASLPEIYRDSAVYLDTNNTDISIEDLLKTEVNTSIVQETLERYTYKNAARMLYEALSL